MPSTQLSQTLIALLRQRGNHLLSPEQIHERLADPEVSLRDVERAVAELEQEGVIIAARGRRYSLLELTPYHAGIIKVHPDGFGTLYGGGEDPDIYVDRKSMKGAMNGDFVIVRVDRRDPKYRKHHGRDLIVGETIRILRRAHKTVVGRFRDDPAEPWVVPFDFRLDTDILVEKGMTLDAQDGEMVDVEIDRYPDRSRQYATGRVVEKLGFIGDPGVDIEVVIRKLHIPHEFPAEVLKAADEIPLEVAPEEIARREDLRDRSIVTIDGETAKDFDDAVEVRVLPNGNYMLGVHIADVAHYVRENDTLDREAFERGTSVYFPGRAVPMLPERLSNGICSLRPRVDRLTFSCDIEIDRRGRFLNHRIYKSVIRTKERMTYTNVHAILTGDREAAPSFTPGDEEGPPPGEPGPQPAARSPQAPVSQPDQLRPDSQAMEQDHEEGAVAPRAAGRGLRADENDDPQTLSSRYGYLFPEFERMLELFEILRARREQRGSIDFDLPEAEVMLAESGAIEAIRPSERNVAHRIIEEFMLAANEVVARELVFSTQPGIYRVHQQPDPQKLEDLREILSEFKLTLRGDVEDIRPAEIQRVLKAVQGTPEERFLTNIVLRSMKRAFYREESLGHFALAIEHYCHFTSPIRRYPDLIVHRRLAELISKGPLQGDRMAAVESMHPLYATQSSERERRAEEASREVLEWKKVIFMRDKVGNEYSGIVTGVAPFGLFVELDEIFVQGLIPVATIGGDFWRFAEHEHRLRGESSGRELRLGDHVRIQVQSIDEDRRQIEFRLLEIAGAPIARRER